MMGGGFGSSPIELLSADAMLRGEIYCTGFTYSAAWITGTASALGASSTVDAQIQVNSDSDFVVQEINFLSFSGLDTIIANPDYLLQIILAGSGRQIMNQAQHVGNYTGSYQANRVPGISSYPILLTSNSTITCTLQNRTVTACNRAELMLRGYKVFYTGGSRTQIFHVL